jgi:hypothetical protein
MIDYLVFSKVIQKISIENIEKENYLEFGPGRGDKFDIIEKN